MKARRRGSLSWWTLLVLEKAVDGYVKFEDFIYNPLFERPVKKSELSLVLKRLREQGLIEQVRLKDDVIIKLTEEGRDLVGNFQDQDWDGKWRIVIFDIPEEKRIIRNLFRRNLKKWGFKHLQKSVWISKRNVFERLTNYIKELEIGRWVTVIEADKLSQQPDIINN